MVHKLSLRETQDLIANKPLALVNLRHTPHNKKIIVKALNKLWQNPSGTDTFKTLQKFLREIAPKYKLNNNQDGVRRFLLREMDRISQKHAPKTGKPQKGFFAEFMGKFKFASF